MTKNSFPARYQPSEIEPLWAEAWFQTNPFRSVPDHRQPFTIVMPPPNVTGVLHLGHVLDNTIQDVLIRTARMQGYNACWVPGTDHASIATEVRVVQWLKETKGIQYKWQLTREEFLRYAWQWKEEHEQIILKQLRRLGMSVDWARKVFTMDDHYSQAVTEVFVRLYEEGLIYRDLRMIHWDPVARTALSDEEVIYQEVDGALYYVRYPLVNPTPDTPPFITIATTRPETILADTAIAVHPSDDRYRHLIGQHARVPLINRTIPIIADERVDPEFGTGALKVTPAHDPLDFQIGKTHNLPIISIMDETAHLTEEAGPFAGLSREEARQAIIQALKENNLLERIQPIRHNVGFSQRTHVPVEPRLSRQWFVRMKPLAERALTAATKEKRVHFIPERYLNIYRAWLENIQDWCISRQLWWGHRIPAWYVIDPQTGEPQEDHIIVARSEQEAYQKAQARFGKAVRLQQDPDVLDTWFSSWLWPLQVFHFFDRGKDNNPDFQYYYPTTVLVTGPDIIFFWVARMIMAGLHFANEVPFRFVYFHGIIRDRLGRKMSKSLGNSPDVLQLIQKYGADALRVGVLMASPAGNDLLFDEKLCETGKNFLNKIWNAGRLIHSWQSDPQMPIPNYAQSAQNWMNARLYLLIHQVHDLQKAYRLADTLKLLYSFLWDEFTSIYLEALKPQNASRTLPQPIYQQLHHHMQIFLRLLHPYCPFLTEELWVRLGYADNASREQPHVAFTRYPTPEELPTPSEDPTILTQAHEQLRELIQSIRRFLSYHAPHQPIAVRVPSELAAPLQRWQPLAEKLTRASLEIHTQPLPEHTVPVPAGRLLLGLTPKDPQTLRNHLLKESQRLQKLLEQTRKRLENPQFRERAPQNIVQREEAKFQDIQQRLQEIQTLLTHLT